jgi:GDP-L-fucose synthase
MAAACIHVMNLNKSLFDHHTSPMLSHINVGYGDDVTIAELANLVAKTVGFTGSIDYDATKPDGTPRKLMDSTRLNQLGWKATISLEKGLKMAYQDFLEKDNRQ